MNYGPLFRNLIGGGGHVAPKITQFRIKGLDLKTSHGGQTVP